MTHYDEIIISWEERYLLNKIEDIKIKDKEFFLYQIYGDSHLYGREVLLYIGKSSFIELRLKNHLNGVFGFVNNLSVSIGRLESQIENIEIPESILIANHKPCYNKEYLHDISPDAKKNKIIVINNGNNYMLKTCCTNYWWVNNES